MSHIKIYTDFQHLQKNPPKNQQLWLGFCFFCITQVTQVGCNLSPNKLSLSWTDCNCSATQWRKFVNNRWLINTLLLRQFEWVCAHECNVSLQQGTWFNSLPDGCILVIFLYKGKVTGQLCLEEFLNLCSGWISLYVDSDRSAIFAELSGLILSNRLKSVTNWQ